MTFLQPFILWGLPLILLPVLIHLLNRMRHRPQPWAAMRFLISATRSSVSHARLRQWIILALRVLAVLMLILFLSRPLAGGWLGWALSPAPDAILILLDRSGSMETTLPGSPLSKRQQAIESLAQAAKQFEDSSHLILIDSASRSPQELGKASTLAKLPAASATDTAADIPGLFAAALNWLLENRAGTAEIWLASDLQKSNWFPDDPRWQSLVAQFQALPQRVRIRLLALNQPGQANRAVALKELIRRPRAGQSEVQFALDIQRDSTRRETLPLTVNLEETRTQKELSLDTQSLRWRDKLNLGERTGGGWGSFELPADGNLRDNAAYFVFGPETALRGSIVSSNSLSARLMRLAVAAGTGAAAPVAQIIQPSESARAVWEDSTLIAWIGPLPAGAPAQRIRTFIEEGGTVLFLPSGEAGEQRFEGLGWAEVQATRPERPFRVLRWNEDEGPLAKSDEGLSLPLAYTQFQRRQAVSGAKNILAAFEDGAPLLVRQTLGRGELFFLASLPAPEWSSLGDGPVLVPMVQRMLQSGSRRLQQAASISCGELSAVERVQQWQSLSSSDSEIQTQAGVYRSGDRLLAVNRPPAEDEPDILEAAQAGKLFGPLSFRMLQERGSRGDRLQGEVWRMFVVAMLIFLIGEALLILPQRRVPGSAFDQPTAASAQELEVPT